MREVEDAIQNCETIDFESFAFALSSCVRCRSASITATWLFIFEEENKWRGFQQLKTAAQATTEVYASVPFHYPPPPLDLGSVFRTFRAHAVAMAMGSLGGTQVLQTPS